MKRILFWSLLLLLTGCKSATSYEHYYNERFGFSLDYPSYMTVDAPPENGDGIRCSYNGMEVTAYGMLDPDNGHIIITYCFNLPK